MTVLKTSVSMNSIRNFKTTDMSQSTNLPDVPTLKIGLVINPTAGLGKGEHIGHKVVAEFTAAGATLLNLSARTAQDALARARAACLEGLDALVVVGGDGMVNLGVNATVDTPTPLGVISAGSGNDFARGLDLPVNDVRASVTQIVAAIRAGRIESFDAGVIQPYIQELAPARVLKLDEELDDHHAASSKRWFAGTLSLGLDAAVNMQANSYSWPKGHLKYLRAVVACLKGFKPYGYTVTVNGKKREMTGTLAAVSNAPYFGGGIPIAPHASLTDGKLNLMYAEDLTVGQIFKLFPKLYSGKHMDDPKVHTEEVTEIIIGPGPRGEHPPVGMADGEVIGQVPLKISAAQGALKIVR